MDSWKSGVIATLGLTVGSLFCQCMHWFIYEKTAMASLYLWFTPLVLCFMYRLLMMDSNKNGTIKKSFIFIFAVLIPLIVSALISLYMIISYPDMSMFSDTVIESGTPRELITLYSGRIVITSVYLLVYAGLDALICNLILKKKTIRN